MPKVVDHAERRTRLIQAFWRVADHEESGELPSVRAVAHAAGVSKTNVGHYFDSQGHLVVEAVLWDTRRTVDEVVATDLSRCTLDDAVTALAPLCGTARGRQRRVAVLLHAWQLSAQYRQLQPLAAHIHSCQSEAVEHVLVAMRARRLVHRSRDLIEAGEQTVAFLNGVIVQSTALEVNYPPARITHLLTAHLAHLAARPR